MTYGTYLQLSPSEKEQLGGHIPHDWNRLFIEALYLCLAPYGSFHKLLYDGFLFTPAHCHLPLPLAFFHSPPLHKYSLIFFHAPGTTLEEASLWDGLKTLAKQMSYTLSSGEGSAADYAILHFCEKKPEPLLQALSPFVTEGEQPGVYHLGSYCIVGGVQIPITLAVCRELQDTQYAALRAISKCPSLIDIQTLALDAEWERDPKRQAHYEAYLDELSGVAPHDVARYTGRFPYQPVGLDKYIQIELSAMYTHRTLQDDLKYVENGFLRIECMARARHMPTSALRDRMRYMGYATPWQQGISGEKGACRLASSAHTLPSLA